MTKRKGFESMEVVEMLKFFCSFSNQPVIQGYTVVVIWDCMHCTPILW